MKKFLIIGNLNSISSPSIFREMMNNRLWLGRTTITKFVNPDGMMKKFGNTIWFTNIDGTYNNTYINLTSSYENGHYPKYYNYNAIEVSKVNDIPMNYDGVMGVPVTFLLKWNPRQFELVGNPNCKIVPNGWGGMSQEFVDLYFMQGNKGHYQLGNILAHYVDSNGICKVPFTRILIRRRK